MRRMTVWIVSFFLLTGCAALQDAPLDVPADYRGATVFLNVNDQYEMFQAVLSGYDIGDLQNFHSQHTLPVLVEDAFKQVFGNVEKYERGPSISLGEAGGEFNEPPLFEVKLLDLANDVYNEASHYRSQATLAVAMKSPKGTIFWQQAFRADGYAEVDPQYGLQLGPQDAVVNAVRLAIDQMQDALVKSPQVRTYLRNYNAIQAEKRQDQLGHIQDGSDHQKKPD